MKVEHVHPANLPAVWHQVKPIVDTALTHNVGEAVGSDFVEPLMTGEKDLYVSVNDNYELTGALITTINIHPQKKELFVDVWATITGYADDECYKTFEEALLILADTEGCNYISAYCRKGLSRPLSKKLGWEESYSVMTKHLQ